MPGEVDPLHSAHWMKKNRYFTSSGTSLYFKAKSHHHCIGVNVCIPKKSRKWNEIWSRPWSG
jgi:hypothetical protein